MVIGGFVVHLGTNRHAKRLSGWWGGSDLFKRAIEMYEPDLDEMMDIMMTVFKYVAMLCGQSDVHAG